MATVLVEDYQKLRDAVAPELQQIVNAMWEELCDLRHVVSDSEPPTHETAQSFQDRAAAADEDGTMPPREDQDKAE